jgi:Fic family protein
MGSQSGGVVERIPICRQTPPNPPLPRGDEKGVVSRSDHQQYRLYSGNPQLSDVSMSARLDGRLLSIPVAILHNMVGRISEIDEFKGWWEGFELPGASILSRLEVRSITASTRAATWPQKMGVTKADARPAWRNGVEGQEESLTSPPATGYAKLLRAVFDDYRKMQFGEALIRDFHARLLSPPTRDDRERGKYRTGLGRAVAHHGRSNLEAVALRPSPPDRIPDEMAALTKWTTERLAARRFHPLLVIPGFVLEFLSIRPFTHGNGRLSHVLTELLLLQSGYSYIPYASLGRVIANRWTEHYLALRQSQANRNLPEPDISTWLFAFLDALRAHAAELRKSVKERPDERILSQNHLRVLKLLERHGEVTNRLLCAELDIPRETAKQVLNRLVALNMIRRAGAGRAVRYSLLFPGE